MSGKLIGYIRVSSLEGLEPDKIFTDKVSGKSTQLPALQEMLAYVRDGDTIIVHTWID